MELSALINAEVAAALDGEKVKELVTKKAAEMVEKSIAELFSCYGAIGKQIQEGIKNAIRIDMNEISLPEYNAVLSNHIRRTVEDTLNRVGLSRVNEDIQKMISESVPVEMSLEQVVEAFKKEIIEDYLNDEGEGEIELIIDREDSFNWIHLNPTKVDSLYGQKKYKCQAKFMIYKGEFAAASSDKIDVTKNNFIGALRGFEALLFKMYSARTKITGFDAESVAKIDLTWRKGEDDDNE